jgi:hypothetical protein
VCHTTHAAHCCSGGGGAVIFNCLSIVPDQLNTTAIWPTQCFGRPQLSVAGRVHRAGVRGGFGGARELEQQRLHTLPRVTRALQVRREVLPLPPICCAMSVHCVLCSTSCWTL